MTREGTDTGPGFARMTTELTKGQGTAGQPAVHTTEAHGTSFQLEAIQMIGFP